MPARIPTESDLPSAPGPETVVGVGLSGGADSAITALLLKHAGFTVVGYTFAVWKSPCHQCQRAFVPDAGAVAEKVGIQHRVLDLAEPFRQNIVEPFVQSYVTGTTPSPCVHCNIQIKFGALLEHVLSDGCHFLATGHYARLQRGRNRVSLLKGLDPRKDQSYFLAGLNQDQLSRAIFPLGSRKKRDVGTLALRLGLVPPVQRESQDLCFLPGGDYAALVEHIHPELSRPGPIVDTEGRVLGEHRGTFRYTIGQRKGLGLGGGPWYVLRLVPGTNTVVVGSAEAVKGTHVNVQGVNWITDPPEPGTDFTAETKLRFNMAARKATITVHDPQHITITFEKAVNAITPGQFAVMYEGEHALGGGWIYQAGNSP